MKCSVDDCDLPHKANGFCAMHNARFKRNGHTDRLILRRICCIKDCSEITFSKSGICTKHYKQQWYLKSQGRTELKVRTSEERWINIATGYVMVKHEGKLVYEHRLLAEKALGKPLPKGAIVHHTGARDDNHGPFKLVICPNQEYHALIHKRMKELGYENN